VGTQHKSFSLNETMDFQPEVAATVDRVGTTSQPWVKVMIR